MLYKKHWLNAGCGKGKKKPPENGDSLFHGKATKGQQYLIANLRIIKSLVENFTLTTVSMPL